MKIRNALIMLMLVPAASLAQVAVDYTIQGVPFNKVSINDQFWLPKIENNRTVTIPSSFKKCEETGRVENFVLAHKKTGKFLTTFTFDDTDIYKTIEGASYSLSVHRVETNAKVVTNQDKVALELGPIVYCLEAVDNKNMIRNMIIPDNAVLSANFEANKLSGIALITGEGIVFTTTADGQSINSQKQPFKAIPYYTWCNRGITEMNVWLPRKVTQIDLK